MLKFSIHEKKEGVIKLMNFKSFFLGAILFFPLAAQASADTKRQEAFLQELEAAKYTLTFKYGPTEWKSEYLQWDADAAFEEAKAQMIESPQLTMRDYQRIYRDFLGSLKDYHVSTLFYSSEWSAFPIVVKSVNNRYFITKFDFQLSLSYSDLPFDFDEIDIERLEAELQKCNLGDEVIAVNGVPVATLIEELIDSELNGDRTPTGYALAEKMLFTRYGRRGHQVPKGDFTLTVKPIFGKQHTVNLAWIHVAEWVNDPQKKTVEQKPATKWQKLEKYLVRDYSVGLAKDMLKSPLASLQANDNDEEEEEYDWREKSFVPPLGQIVWETDIDEAFYAYIFKNQQGKKFGYLYLPDFSASGWSAEDFMGQLITIIDKFESETEALVVDINDNSGGNLFYMYGVLSLLADKPLETCKNTEVLVQEDIYNMAVIYNELIEMLDNGEVEGTISGYPIDETVIRKIIGYAKSLIDQWNSGETRTVPDYVFGIDTLDPHHEVHYTKPILVLINELDFSCGDLFPAILQDNGRATLFGRKTAGAGGYVRPYQQTSQFGVELYTLTGSLAYRVDGKVVENLGVTPDIENQLTEKDLQHGFIDYVRSVNKQLNVLVK